MVQSWSTGHLPPFHVPFWLSPSLLIYFTYVLVYVQGESIISKQGYGLENGKGSEKGHGNAVIDVFRCQ